jgi:hypothetical protein
LTLIRIGYADDCRDAIIYAQIFALNYQLVAFKVILISHVLLRSPSILMLQIFASINFHNWTNLDEVLFLMRY